MIKKTTGLSPDRPTRGALFILIQTLCYSTYIWSVVSFCWFIYEMWRSQNRKDTHTHVLPFLKLNWQLQVNPFNQLNRNNWWLNNFSMITLLKEMNRSCQTYMWTLIWFEAISAMMYVTYMKRSLSRWIHLFN